MKTKNLTGLALDYAVCMALQEDESLGKWIKPFKQDGYCYRHKADFDAEHPYSPSTSIVQGMGLVEREWIATIPYPNESDENRRWCAIQYDRPKPVEMFGPTLLVAAMRCYVASVLGEDVYTNFKR